MAEYLDIEMRAGETPTVVGYLRDENGTLVNDPTAQYLLAVRPQKSIEAADIFTVQTSQFAAGEGRCPIPVNATSSFTYDRTLYYTMTVTETNGNQTTLLTGRLRVRVD